MASDTVESRGMWGAIYCIENPCKQSMVLIEGQIGNYLGEDDIGRNEDLYSRQWRTNKIKKMLIIKITKKNKYFLGSFL